jgi:dGTPase
MAEEERQLKSFLYSRMYRSPPILAIQSEAKEVLAALFAAYRADPSLLPPEWRPQTDDPVATLRRIGDYIAGMTDRFAIRQHQALIGPAALPEGF